MPSTVTAYSVKIATPRDAAHELYIAREVIADWNSQHALAEKRILLPLDAAHARDAAQVDMLIAFFCNPPDVAADETPEGIEEEIETQLKAGKPVLIYFSEARAALTNGPTWQCGTPDEFKKRYMTAVVDTYESDKEFRAKFIRHLDTAIATHDHFKEQAAAPAVEPKPLDPRRTGPLSPWAQSILIEACDDFEGYIGHLKVGGMLRIQANGKQLVEDSSPETIAKWEGAFNELLAGGYIRNAGYNLFQISERGFEFLKTLGKTPVGYITELGGM